MYIRLFACVLIFINFFWLISILGSTNLCTIKTNLNPYQEQPAMSNPGQNFTPAQLKTQVMMDSQPQPGVGIGGPQNGPAQPGLARAQPGASAQFKNPILGGVPATAPAQVRGAVQGKGPQPLAGLSAQNAKIYIGNLGHGKGITEADMRTFFQSHGFPLFELTWKGYCAFASCRSPQDGRTFTRFLFFSSESLRAVEPPEDQARWERDLGQAAEHQCASAVELVEKRGESLYQEY